MKNSLWKLKKEKVNKTNLFRYSNFVSKKFKINFHNDFNELWKWSINNKIDFWESVWNFTNVKGKKGKIFFKRSKFFYKNKFFPDAELNYTENLLSKKDSSPAIIFKSENGYKNILSWKNSMLTCMMKYGKITEPYLFFPRNYASDVGV